ncbi:MAG TPA: glycosyltransferase [Gemmatimonadaceae bacterium]|jgi:dolichol-phosphate mannosyltransferase
MIFVLLPAYNEEDALEPLAEKIDAVMRRLDADYEIVVVNDGSRDRTAAICAELAGRYPLRIITHRINRGLGETARDGFEYIAEHGDRSDVVVRMDCDDTHDPGYIVPMVEKLREGYEVVIASRYAPGGDQIGLDWYRRTISRCANLLMKTVFPIRGVWEYTSGFRAYRVALIQDAIEIYGNHFIDLKGMGFTGTVEKLIKCRQMGAHVGEVGFVLRYDQKLSVSKVVTSLTTLGYLTLIAKYVAPWGELGRLWLRRCAERRRTAYGPDGRPIETIQLKRACAELPV